MSGLEDLTVIIVGDADGLEIELARQLVWSGTQRIGLIDYDVARGERAADEIRRLASGIWALFARADLACSNDVERAAAELASALGDADVVVFCAGPTWPVGSAALTAGARVAVSAATVAEVRRQAVPQGVSQAQLAHQLLTLAAGQLGGADEDPVSGSAGGEDA